MSDVMTYVIVLSLSVSATALIFWWEYWH